MWVMRRKLNVYKIYRAWRFVAVAGLTGLFASFAAARAIAVASGGVDVLWIALASVAGAAASMAIARAVSGAAIIRKLSSQNRRREVALDNMVQGLCLFDGQHRLVVWNRQYQDMYKIDDAVIRRGATLAELLASRKTAGTLLVDPKQYEIDLKATIARGQAFTHEVETDNGHIISVVNSPTAEGGWVATHEDVTERRRAEHELDRTRAFLDTIIENVPSPIIVKGVPNFEYLLINRAAEKYLGIDRAEMLGKSTAEVMPAANAAVIEAEDHRMLATSEACYLDEHTVQTPGNGTRIVTASRLPVKDAAGKPQYLITVIRDLTERKRHEQRIAHLAHHDPLTDLPNRAAFNKCIEAIVEMATASKESFAVFSIDLDRFKAINDDYGHSTGDAVLTEVARRLETAGQGAFVARVGGDEFAIITPVGPQPSSAEALAARLATAFDGDISTGGHSLHAGLTIGVGVFPQDGADAATLVANADAALSRAKSEARGSIRFFEMAMDVQLREKRALQQDLRKAVENEELELHYQPQASIDGAITGFEALLRWHHPVRGLVPPCDFIPLAEESGIIGALGEWVLRTACLEAASWPKPINIAVNLSPVQFQHGDLPNLVHQVLLETGLSPARLELEITEGVLIGDFTRAVAVLRRLKNLGVRIAMDDFGTGYSSLSYLQSFPFDSIKIDRTFIANLAHSQQSRTIVRAVIALSRGLNVPVLAEGVETQEQLDFLTAEKCVAVQGYLIGRPKPIAAYAGLVGRKPAARARRNTARAANG
jgi:diguanylate cyclase (GGDEF)-like protein/PAS domain S-box-containing protein